MAAGAEFIGPGRTDPVGHTQLLFTEILPNEGDLLLAGQYLRNTIRDRTFRGEALTGGAFQKYSDAYAKKKGQTNVDLYSRGPSKHMLDALTARVEGGTSVEVGIFGDQEMATRAKVHNEGATIPVRKGDATKKSPRKRRLKGLLALFTDIEFDERVGSTFSMPRREWLGARLEDLNEMTRIIGRSIQERIERI